MVAAGLGVAALPELAAAVAPQAGLVQRRLVDPDIPRPIGLVTRRGRSLSPASAAMVEFLRREVQRLVPHRNTLPATPPKARKSPLSRVARKIWANAP